MATSLYEEPPLQIGCNGSSRFPTLRDPESLTQGRAAPGVRTVQKSDTLLRELGRESFPAIIMQEILLSGGSMESLSGLYLCHFIILALFWLQDNKVVTLKYILFPLWSGRCQPLLSALWRRQFKHEAWVWERWGVEVQPTSQQKRGT